MTNTHLPLPPTTTFFGKDLELIGVDKHPPPTITFFCEDLGLLGVDKHSPPNTSTLQLYPLLDARYF